MAFQTAEVARPILQRGPVPMPVVSRELVRPKPVEVAVVECAPSVRIGSFRPEQIAEMRRLRAEGKCYKFIAGVLKCHEKSAKRHAGDVALPAGQWMQGTGRPKITRKPFAERLRRSGFTYKEIADELGCSESAAWYLLNGRPEKRAGKRIAIHRLVHNVARAIGLSSGDFRARPNGRFRCPPSISKARYILYYIAYDRMGKTDERADGLSLVNLGRSLGNVHHTTVLHGLRRAREAIAKHNIDVSGGVPRIARNMWAASW